MKGSNYQLVCSYKTLPAASIVNCASYCLWAGNDKCLAYEFNKKSRKCKLSSSLPVQREHYETSSMVYSGIMWNQNNFFIDDMNIEVEFFLLRRSVWRHHQNVENNCVVGVVLFHVNGMCWAELFLQNSILFSCIFTESCLLFIEKTFGTNSICEKICTLPCCADIMSWMQFLI